MRLKIRRDSYYAKIFASFWASKHGQYFYKNAAESEDTEHIN
jgi:hypothetical protein